VLLALDQQIRALTVELEKAAPAALPKGMGALSTVVISREICNGQRFNNRRQVSSYTGLCPGEYSSGSKRVTGLAPNMEMGGYGLLWSNWHDVCCAISPDITRCKSAHCPGKRSPSYQVAAQESHCRRGSSARCRPLETSYWTLHTRSPRI
jgi:Transposase IS116/IS110/IS902 family